MALDDRRAQDNIAILVKLPPQEVINTLAQARENGDTDLIILCERELLSRRSEDKY